MGHTAGDKPPMGRVSAQCQSRVLMGPASGGHGRGRTCRLVAWTRVGLVAPQSHASAGCQCLEEGWPWPAEGLPVAFSAHRGGSMVGVELVPGRCCTGLPGHWHSQSPPRSASVLLLHPAFPASLGLPAWRHPSLSVFFSPLPLSGRSHLLLLLPLPASEGGFRHRVPLFSCILLTILLVFWGESIHSFSQHFLHVCFRAQAHSRCTKTAGQSESSVMSVKSCPFILQQLLTAGLLPAPS